MKRNNPAAKISKSGAVSESIGHISTGPTASAADNRGGIDRYANDLLSNMQTLDSAIQGLAEKIDGVLRAPLPSNTAQAGPDDHISPVALAFKERAAHAAALVERVQALIDRVDL